MNQEHTAEIDALPKCAHCGHVRGLHGRNHGCISAFADGKPGQSCGCSGYVTPPVKGD